MDDALKRKLESLSKDELLELLEELCRDEEISKTVKLFVSPSERSVDDLCGSFQKWCHSYANGSRLERTVNALYNISSLLFSASEKLGAKKSAEISYKVYKECESILEYDDDALVDIMYEAKHYIGEALKDKNAKFTPGEIEKYSCVAEDE